MQVICRLQSGHLRCLAEARTPGQVSAKRPSRACSLTIDGWEAVLSTVHRDHGPGAKVDAITIMHGDQIPDRYLATVE
jgi:hypothetical protein